MHINIGESSYMNGKKVFYKYKNLDDKSFDYVLDSLKNKYFYFSTPEELNDPFDCFAPLDNSATDKQLEDWILKNKFYNDMKIKNVREILDMPNSYNDFLESEKEALKNLHVFSLSEDCENEMMWAMYANNYTGLVLGYVANRINNDWCLPLISDKERNMANSKYISYIRLRKILYDNDGTKKYNQFLDNKENINYSLIHKKNHWSGEKEYRALLTTVNVCSVKLKYPDYALADIIFGYKTCKSKVLDIKNVVSKNYSNVVKFYTAKPNYYSYKIEILPEN